MANAARLTAVLYCRPEAVRFNGESLTDALQWPDKIAATRPLEPNELHDQFVSVHLRPQDIPLAFHRESTPTSVIGGLNARLDNAQKLEAYGKTLQYLFEDGLILTGQQILFHPYSKTVPRHLLPLNVNVTQDARTRRLHAGRIPSWQTDADHVVLSVLISAARIARMAAMSDEVDPVALYFSIDANETHERLALRVENLELSNDEWGPWRLTTAIHDPHSGVHYGRARIELDSDQLGNLNGLSESFFIDTENRKLIFHGFGEQVQRMRAHTPTPPSEPTEIGVTQTPSAPSLSIHLSGHAQIQAALEEVSELIGKGGENKSLRVHPDTFVIGSEDIKPHLHSTSDGTFKFRFNIQTAFGELEAHGLPQSTAYLLLNLQHGLGATTGYSNTQLAHARKGLKRDRDIKILRNIGQATLIFFEAASFALGLPLSDGTKVNDEKELCESLFTRLGSMLLKSEGWPVQSGSLEELCSKNVTTLIEGFVKQVISDIRGRDIRLYLPQGEFRLEGATRHIALLFYAIVSDLAVQTDGGCFTKVKGRAFEDFLNGRAHPEREDLAVRQAVDAETSARMVYQPGINERYRFPEFQRTGEQVLSLLNRGFEVSVDGKEVEEFNADEFRPEFTLRENEDQVVPTGGHKINWFELHPKFFFKGVEISGEQAYKLSKEGLIEFQGKLYRVASGDLPSLQRLTRFWASIQSHNAGLVKGPKRRSTEETFYQLPRSQTLELLALRASGVKMRGGERWNEICRFYDSLDAHRPDLELPPTFKTELQPYQKTGVQWIKDLHDLGLGGILADDMGLGKTVTTLAFLELLRSEGKMGTCLVIVPTSLTYNWLSEAQKFTPDIPISIFSGRESEAMLDFVQGHEHGLVVCTYGLLQEHIEMFQQVKWSCVILDEAQNLKNITTKRTTAARKLDAAYKLCLTGTPIENHYGELYSLFDLIVPGALGDLPSFRERYVNPTRVLKDDIDYLRLKTRPLLLRRTKSQVLHQLPPKVETTVKLPFDDEQRKIYRDIASSYNEQVRQQIAKQGEAKSQLQMLTALLRLRQVCSDPSSVPGVKYHGEPPKVSTLLETVQALVESGESALIFTQFLTTYDRIRTALTAANIRHYDINGSDSRLNREKKLRSFQEEEGGAVMLMTLKTGGVGLNLVKASYIFHIEPWWNPAVENQATDRAHRIGQTKTVQVYRYLIKDSVEEKIEVLKDIKSKRFDALFANAEEAGELGTGSSSLSQKDFEFLLG